jgi:hypothetical protein
MGAATPVGPPDYPLSDGSLQHAGCGGLRRCLLKQCEQLFRPAHPLCRYCGERCQEAARYWQRWHAACRYRSTLRGQELRREQNRRYRERQRQRRAEEAARLAVAEAAVEEAAVEEREGQLKEDCQDFFAGTPCDRPGCYVLFTSRPHEPRQRFCCSSCRRALRRVLEREARWYRRRDRSPPCRYRPPRRC